MVTKDTLIAGKIVACQIIIKSGNLALVDSVLTGEVYNYGSGSVLVKNSVINGGADHTETILGSNVTVDESNLYGNQHEVYCGNNCKVIDSWLHGNHDFGVSDHENGFLATGGQGYTLQHNSISCSGHCTGDATFLGNISDASISRDLFVATEAAYCLYPSSGGTSSIVNRMTVVSNVFQRGHTGKCATYGPVAGWDAPNNSPGASGYHNVWSGNTWDVGNMLHMP